MEPMTFITAEAREIHAIFENLFFVLCTVLLTIGLALEHFKVPLGDTPRFPVLIGRALIAGILLVSYPDIANLLASVSDSLASRLGDLNNYKRVLGEASRLLDEQSFSWTNVGDSFVLIVSYASFFLLHLSVYFFNAAIGYAWVLLYVFSPILIALYILPQTAGATSALFRSLFEVSAWKICFSVLGTLLWSSALDNFSRSGDSANVITTLSLSIMLALSVLLTPLVVKALIGKGISSLASNLSTASGAVLTSGVLGPAGLKALALGPTKAGLWGSQKAITKPFGAIARKVQSRSGVGAERAMQAVELGVDTPNRAQQKGGTTTSKSQQRMQRQSAQEEHLNTTKKESSDES